MTKELCHVLRNKLVALSFADLVAGLVQPVIDTRYSEENTPVSKRMPVTYDWIAKYGEDLTNIVGSEMQLCPNENRKSVMYFEDLGTTQDTSVRVPANMMAYSSRVRLVVWLNKLQIGKQTTSEVTGTCIAEILRKLSVGAVINEGNITRCFCTLSQMAIQDAAIFSRYNYDEAETQYLRPPFEYFALDFTCRYVYRIGCE